VLASLLLAPTLGAQKAGWGGEAEGNASLFFGNTRQWLVAARTKLGHRDSTLEVRGEAHVSYAKSATDSSASVVTGRAWFGSFGVDYRPFGRWSPFVSGTVESSLEQRLHRRYSAGLGAKYTITHTEKMQFDVSLAALGERTEPLVSPSDTTRSTTRLRWSGRIRAQRRLGARMRFTHTTFYQPSARDFSHYTITTTSALTIDLTKVLALTVTLQDAYDSEARQRGARSNNDGQFLIGLRATY
jgi:hypothetical protein